MMIHMFCLKWRIIYKRVQELKIGVGDPYFEKEKNESK